MELKQLAEKVGIALKHNQVMLATAESCTGRWVAREITAIPGSSHWLDILEFTDPNRLATVKARVSEDLRHTQLFLDLRSR